MSRITGSAYAGITQLPTELADGVRRLDTGHYVLELCRGTADGTAAGKWGIRYFEAKAEGKNLIKDCGNAISRSTVPSSPRPTG